MTRPIVLTVRRRFDAPPERVFDAWLDPQGVGRWLFATPGGRMERIEIDPRPGGRFMIAERRGQELAEHFGTYVEIDRPHRLVFDFATSFAPDAATRVTVTIDRDGDGSQLTLEHEGVWADYEDRTREGWTMILGGLARTLASQ